MTASHMVLHRSFPAVIGHVSNGYWFVCLTFDLIGGTLVGAFHLEIKT
jgi:hypothetical protein